MIRRELTARLGRELGLKPDNVAQKEVLDDLINDAAFELYTQTDLPRALMEEQFGTDSTDPLPRVTLPGRVGEVRAIRDSLSPVKLHDIRPKYNTLPWPKDVMYTFRILAERPICRSIDNALGLYMEPLSAANTQLEVAIVGRTEDAQEIHGVFDWEGNGTAQGILFEDIYDITKNVDTAEDVILKLGNTDGAEMARIYTTADRALYIEIELQEFPSCCADQIHQCARCLDVLYKPPFRWLNYDTSSFQLAGHDMAIIYKAVEIYRLRGLGTQATQDQVAAVAVMSARANTMLKNSIHDKIQGEQLIINWGPGRGDMRNIRGLRRRRYSVGGYITQ